MTRDRRKPHPGEDRPGMTAAVLLAHRALRATHTPASPDVPPPAGRGTRSA
jgi:hypothetical protein